MGKSHPSYVTSRLSCDSTSILKESLEKVSLVLRQQAKEVLQKGYPCEDAPQLPAHTDPGTEKPGVVIDQGILCSREKEQAVVME